LEFEWGEAKSEVCFNKHGFDFADVVTKVSFEPNRVIEPDVRRDFGEERYRRRGYVDGRL